MPSKRGNGEGSISKRQDGRWCAVATVGRNPGGSLKRKFIYGKTRQEVAKKLAELQNEILTDQRIEPSSITMKEWLEKWLWKYKKIEIRPTTLGSYEQQIRIHIDPELGHIKLKDLNSEYIQTFYNEKYEKGRYDKSGGLSAATLRKIHNIIYGALEKAVDEKLIPYNYCKNTSLPKIIKKEVRAFNSEEQKKFIEALKNESLGTAFMVSLFAGLRRGEVLGLKWDNVDTENNIIRIRQAIVRSRVFNQIYKTEIIEQDPKTKKGKRNIPLPEIVMELLIKHKEKQSLEKLENKDNYVDKGYVFATETGNSVEPRNYLRTFYRLIKNLGIENANVHTLRHSYATRGLELNIPLQVLQELMGHASITTLVDTYGHALPETKTEAATKYNNLLKNNNEDPSKE